MPTLSRVFIGATIQGEHNFSTHNEIFLRIGNKRSPLLAKQKSWKSVDIERPVSRLTAFVFRDKKQKEYFVLQMFVSSQR